jgi:hypothetical protein
MSIRMTLLGKWVCLAVLMVLKLGWILIHILLANRRYDLKLSAC